MDIKRITFETSLLISDIEQLLDESTKWDSNEGKKFLANTDNLLLIGYLENAAAGFLSAHRLQRFDKRKAEVLLYEIGVHEAYQRRGIGKALIEALKVWAKEVEADEIWVLTNKSNISGMSLYAATGGIIENTDEQMFTIKI